MEAGHNGKKSPFRWLLAAARYAAASMMTVLILIVTVKAIKVLLLPGSLSISISEGCIFVKRIRLRDESPALTFVVGLTLVNARNDVRMHFDNTTGYLFASGNDSARAASSTYLFRDCLVAFSLKGSIVRQHHVVTIAQESTVPRDPEGIQPDFFDKLYSSSQASITSDVTMRIDGTLTQVISTSNYHTRNTTYYCWPLVVGLDPDVYRNQDDISNLSLEDVFCREEQGKHLI
jgi:hypothetical protein